MIWRFTRTSSSHCLNKILFYLSLKILWLFIRIIEFRIIRIIGFRIKEILSSWRNKLNIILLLIWLIHRLIWVFGVTIMILLSKKLGWWLLIFRIGRNWMKRAFSFIFDIKRRIIRIFDILIKTFLIFKFLKFSMLN